MSRAVICSAGTGARPGSGMLQLKLVQCFPPRPPHPSLAVKPASDTFSAGGVKAGNTDVQKASPHGKRSRLFGMYRRGSSPIDILPLDLKSFFIEIIEYIQAYAFKVGVHVIV